MRSYEAHGERRTEYAPASDAPPGSSHVISVDLADDEEVRWHWTHYPGGQSVVTGYDIVKRDEGGAQGGFDFEEAVDDWLRPGGHDGERGSHGEGREEVAGEEAEVA